MIVASNDPYLRIFSIIEFTMIKIIKSFFGYPLCIEVNKDKNLLAVGYEDDSFVIYDFKN